MAAGVRKDESKQPPAWRGWSRYEAQEPDNPDRPDIERPPDFDKPEWDDRANVPHPPGAPPFTGEDSEDVGDNPDPKSDVPLM
jgi:hypothetical protein